jgi:hypothetical protein
VLGGEPAHRAPKEGAGVICALAGEHLAVGDAAAVIDGHVQVVPAGARRALDAVGEDALADLVKASQALGVHVQQLARARPLVAHHRGARRPVAGRASMAGQHLAHRRGGDPEHRSEARRPVAAGRARGQDARLELRRAAARLAMGQRPTIAKGGPATGVKRASRR